MCFGNQDGSGDYEICVNTPAAAAGTSLERMAKSMRAGFFSGRRQSRRSESRGEERLQRERAASPAGSLGERDAHGRDLRSSAEVALRRRARISERVCSSRTAWVLMGLLLFWRLAGWCLIW